jgi:hypothetical protein
VKAGVNEQKPLVFLLPESENTYRTRLFHPMKREMFDSLDIDKTALVASDGPELDSDEMPSKKLCLRRPLFTPSEDQSKFLQTQEVDTGDVRTDDEATREEATPIRRPRQKWSAEEKNLFVEVLEAQPSQTRPDWKLFSDALRSKSLEQIKNFYYDYKKPAGRNRGGDRKRARRQDETSTPTPMAQQTDSVPATPAAALEPQPEHQQLYAAARLASLPFHPIQQAQAQIQQQQPQPQQPQPQQPQPQPRHSNHPYGDLYANEMSRTSTPDPMELAWTQQLLLGQGGQEAARRLLTDHGRAAFPLLQSHQQQQQHQQLRSSLMSWPNPSLHHHHHHHPPPHQHHHHHHAAAVGGGGGGDSWTDQQHQHHQLLLRLQHQQQTNQQQLAALGLGGYNAHHRPDEAQLALAQHLLNLQRHSNNSNNNNSGGTGGHHHRGPSR